MVEIGPVELYNLISIRCILGQGMNDAIKHAQTCYTYSPVNSGVDIKRCFMNAGVLERHNEVQVQHNAKQEGHSKSQEKEDVCKFSCLNVYINKWLIIF